ncbi:MAG TPA: PEP-CTERM sorting domain-containing protein [Caldimonas sp.]
MKILRQLGPWFGVLVGAIASPGVAHAGFTSFTTKASFDAAIAGLGAVQTVNFDSLASGTTFASGTGTGGLTFTYAIAGPSTLEVSSTFGTTSGADYLGLDNPDTAFYLGDSFTINFNRTVQAVGLYVIAGSDAQAGDMELSAGGGSTFNSASFDALVSDGQAFYLGLVQSDPLLGFTTATVQMVFTPDAFLAVTVDDITSAVAGIPPVLEPETWALLAAGLGALALRRKRGR